MPVTDNALVRYDGTGGALLDDSTVTLADDGTIAVSGNTVLDADRVFKLRNYTTAGLPAVGQGKLAFNQDIGSLTVSDGINWKPGGNVLGPDSSNDNNLVRFDSTTGKIIQQAPSATVDDDGLLTVADIRAGLDYSSATEIRGTGNETHILLETAHTSNTSEVRLNFSNTTGDGTVADNDTLGRIRWAGWINGSFAYFNAAYISAEVNEASPTNTALGSQVVVATNPVGSATQAEQVRFGGAARINVAAGTTAAAQINLASSTAPTSPADGDIWFDGTDLKIRISGATKTFTVA